MSTTIESTPAQVAVPVVESAVVGEETPVVLAEEIKQVEPATTSTEPSTAVAPIATQEDSTVGESATAPAGVEGAVEGTAAEVKDDTKVSPSKDKSLKTETRSLFARIFHTFSHDGAEQKVKTPKVKKVKSPKAEKSQAAAETPATAEVTETPAAVEPATEVATVTEVAAAPVAAAPVTETEVAAVEAPKEETVAPLATESAAVEEKPVNPKINRRLSSRIGQFIGKVTSKKEHTEAKTETPAEDKAAETAATTEATSADVVATSEEAPVLEAPTALAPLGDVSETTAEEKPAAPAPVALVSATA